MAFQIKDFLSIVASMVNHMRGVTSRFTDYNVGSVARTLVEAPAVEIDEMYQQMLHGLVEAIPVATYHSFSFGLLPAQAASGLVRVTVTPGTAAVVVPAGTTFTRGDGGATYVASLDMTFPVGGGFVDVPVVAPTPGVVGNAAPGTGFSLSPTPANFVLAVNLAALGNGRDVESEDQRRLRFQHYIVTLARGTPAAIRYALGTANLLDAAGTVLEQVAYARVVESTVSEGGIVIGPGPITCFVHNGVGGTSQALVARAQQIVSGYYDAAGNPVAGYKAAGIPCTVYAAAEQPVPITGTVAVAPGTNPVAAAAAVTAALAGYVVSLDVGASCLFAKLDALALGVPGVLNLSLAVPSGGVDTTPPPNSKLMPGAISIVPA